MTISPHSQPTGSNILTNSSFDCSGTVTWYPGQPGTITITTTETISVSVTDPSTTLPQPSTTIPLPYCTTVTIEPFTKFTCTASACPEPTSSAAAASSVTAISVTVTKKTWVPVYTPPTDSPPDFNPQPTNSRPGGNINQGGDTPGSGGGSPGSSPASSNPDSPGPGSGSSGSPGGNAGSPGPAGGNTQGGGNQGPSGSQGIGDIIASAFGVPQPAAPSSNVGSGGGGSGGSGGSSGGGSGSGAISPAPVDANINGVWLVAAPTAVIVGSHLFQPPAAGNQPITINESGQVFTIGASQIIGSGTTIAIPVPGTTPMTLGAVSFSIGASQAVFGDKTYAIGPGAQGTTTVINGQTISIGPSGVSFATSTVAPQGQITSPPLSAVTAGGVVFYVDASRAIIDGTTYRIGPGASRTVTVIHGMTVTFGASGISYGTTTLRPPAMTTSDSSSEGSSPTSSSGGGVFASATQTGGQTGRASSTNTSLLLIVAIGMMFIATVL